MRHLHTIVCAAVLLAVGLSGKGFAQEDEPTADRFANRDLLESAAYEQRLWVNAFMAGMTNAVALRDIEAARCVSRWYRGNEDRAFRTIQTSFEAYPERRPAEIIFAIARRECPNLLPDG